MKVTNVLQIKNMVCNRCIRVVKEDLQKLGHEIQTIELGKVTLSHPVSNNQLTQIGQMLETSGFELLSDRQSKLIEVVKTMVIDHIHHKKTKPEEINFSDFLAREIGVNYYYLSKLFSSLEGITIEKYIILQKIERVKELLFYDEKSLGEIAFELGYSSVSHLSGQFKKVTGLTPTAFKKLKNLSRIFLDRVNQPKK